MINRRPGNHSSKNKIGRRVRSAASSIVMNAPMQILIDKLEKNKFIKNIDDKLVPRPVLNLTPPSH